LKYKSFRLQIMAGAAKSYTIYASSPGGEGQAPFVSPFRPEEAGTLQMALWHSVHPPPGQGADKSVLTPKKIGEQLFEALFTGEILHLYQRSFDLLEGDSKAGLRLELMLDPHDSSLAAFQAFPWELLRQRDTPESPGLSRRRPVVRYLTMPKPVYLAPLPPALRIVIVAASPQGLAPLNLARELHNLQEAVRSEPRIELVATPSPTLSSLRKTLLVQECHVLHFMGHGGSVAGREERVLFFETEDGKADPVTGTDLVNKLTDFPFLRLAVLNACESATLGSGASISSAVTNFDPFTGVASSLVLGGLPAVIAMQLPISDQAAIAFSKALYDRIAAGDPVDAAVAEGRQAVHSANRTRFEWATPVLFMRTPNGELYPGGDISPPKPWLRWTLWSSLLLSATLLVLFFGQKLSRDNPQLRAQAPESSPMEETSSTPKAGVTPQPMETTSLPQNTPPAKLPINLTLRDGGKTTLPSAQVTIGVHFTQVGKVEVATVTVNNKPHPFFTDTPPPFSFSAKEKLYRAYIRIYFARKTVNLRIIDQKRPISGEE
jgi:hypothetical protein